MKKGFFYRLIVITLSYALIGGIVFSSLAKATLAPWAFWLVVGIFAFLYIASIVVVEILQYRAKKIK